MADTTARIRLALEGAGAVQQGLAGVEGKISSLRGSVAGLAGGLSAAGFATWIKGAIDAADDTGKMAQKTGLLTEQVAGLQLAFDQAGAGDKLQATLVRLAKEASNGNESFKAMGVTVTGTDGKLKSTRQLLGEVSEKFAGYRDGAEKTALAQELFGKSGADLIPVLNGGAQALQDYDDKAKALGLTLDEETTKAAEQFNDQVDILMQRTQGVARQIASELLPVLTAVSAEFANGAEKGGAMSAAGQFLSSVIETVAVAGANVSFVLQALARDGAAIYNVYANIASLDFEGMRKGVAAYKTETLAARAELDAFERRVLQSRKVAESLKGAEGLDEPKFRRLLGAGGTAAKEAAPHVEKLTGSVGRQRAAVKGLTDAEKELAEIRKQDLAVGVLRNKQAEDNYKAAQQAADVESQFRQIVIDKEMDWQQEADDEKLKASREILQRQQKETEDFWTSVDSTAHDVFVSVATEGEDAFKRIGKTLKAAILDMLYQMTIKKWIFQISGVGGGGTGNSLVDLGMQAYQAYTGGGGGGLAGLFGGGTAAAGGASVYGSSYAAGSVSNAAMVSTGSTAAAGGTASSTMASGGFTGYGYLGYAALIAAAVMIAENLYAKGYTRAALGKGPGQNNQFGQYSSVTADNRMGNSSVYNASAENFNRKLFDALGVNNKWADILSGTTRMATLFGRKLGAYGYEANIAGGDAEVGGFARYKGGLFSSNKTTAINIDPRDAANFDAIVESTIEGSRAMARAMGLNESAIDGYTGKIRVNFKNAKTAEEQSKRMAEAMDNLNFELLKTASGGKLARDDFKQMMEDIQKDIQASGISGEGIADILVQGMTGRLSGADVGDQLASMLVGGIYNAIASSYASQIASLFMNQIITPIFAAIAAGVPISQAVSAASIKATVATARQYMAVVGEIFNDPAFRAFMEEFKTQLGVTGNAAASVAPPAIRSFGGPSAASTAADEARREKEQLEMEILRLQGNTVEIRRRELLQIKPGNRALQQRLWALEDEKEILDERRDLERELLELQGNTNALRALERDALHASNRALFDQIKALEDVEKLKDTWGGVIDAMSDEMNRLREEILGTTPEGRAYAMAEFALATGQARAGDAAAADRLPDLARTLVDIASETAGSLSDLRAVQGGTLASLAETREILGATYGIELPRFAVGTNYVPRDMLAMIHEGEAVVPKAFNPAAGGGSQAELVAAIRDLHADIRAIKGLGVGQLATAGRVEQLLDGVTNGGTVMRSREVAL
jgi:hypothetical protein